MKNRFTHGAILMAAWNGFASGGGTTWTEQPMQEQQDAALLSEEEFQQKVLGAQKKTQDTQETLLTNFDNLDKQTKAAIEELTKIKNDFGGLDSDVKALDLAMKKANLLLTMEQRMSNHGTAMTLGQRTLRDEESVHQVFRGICKFIGKPEFAVKALGEDTSPGSTMINAALDKDVYNSLLSYGAWGTLGVRPVGTRDTKVLVKTARPIAYGVLVEGAQVPDDANKAGTSVTLEMELYAVLLNVSLQLIEDGEIDVVADVLDDFIEAINYRLDYVCFAGNGTEDATNVGVTGLFNFGTAAVATAGRTTIAATKYDDWLKCLTAVDAVVLTRASRWWIHPTNIAASMGVQDLNGRPIFQTALEAPGRGLLNIFGYPVSPVGAAPSANGINAKVAGFGDPRAFAAGLRRGFTFEASDQAKWDTFQRSFRGSARFDAKGAKASALSVLTLPGA